MTIPADGETAAHGAMGTLGFVPVRRIAAASPANPFSQMLLVEYELSQLPARVLAAVRARALDTEDIPEVSGPRASPIALFHCSAANADKRPLREPPLSRYPRGWRLGVAWGLNLLVLCATWFGVLLASSSSSADAAAAHLEASSRSYPDWWSAAAMGSACAGIRPLPNFWSL